MKLFTRYNRINIVATLSIFLLGSVAFYFVLRYLLVLQLDETLRSEQQEIESYVRIHNRLPEIENTSEQWISFYPVAVPVSHAAIKTIAIYSREEEEQEWIRQIVFPLQVAGRRYNIVVSKSEVETEELLRLIIPVVIFIAGMILVVNFVINRKVISRTWQPFYDTLGKIEKYSLSKQTALDLPPAAIDEIALLNLTLNDMTKRIHHDYQVLKSFTENAAHEMQTPLAIIRSKADMLLQEPGWTEKSIGEFQVIEQATEKLSKLHRSLLLLSKIENLQFVPDEQVRLDLIVQNKIKELADWFSNKNIDLKCDCREVLVLFNQQLAEILISNLLVNAIHYTPPGGKIRIILDHQKLSVANTAFSFPLDPEKIFQRFYKADYTSEGSGLGLAIVKEIASLAGFSIGYRCDKGEHDFCLQFG